MEDSIKKLTDNIDNNCKELIKDNKLLINGYKIRLIKRLLNIFSKYKIPFNKELLETVMTDYLINTFRNSSVEVCNSYKKVLYKYFDIVNEYYNSYSDSKDKIKNATSVFIKKIFSNNPILNEKISQEFIANLKLKTLVYDNYYLNTDLESRIIEDTNEVMKEIIHNNKEYLIKSIKEILIYLIEQ